jgi:hypothetical protein
MTALALTRPGGEDRPPLEVTVCTEPGGWTPAPYVTVEAGNVVELTADELVWLVTAAGPWALARLRELDRTGTGRGAQHSEGPGVAGRGKPADLQSVGQHPIGGPDQPVCAVPDGERSPPSQRSSIDDPPLEGAGSSAAGQGVPDPRPEPAPSSSQEAGS